MINPKERYEKRKKTYGRLRDKQTRRANQISNLRLIAAAVGGTAAVLLYMTANYYLFAGVILGTLILFGYLIMEHHIAKRKQGYFSTLYRINEIALMRLDGEWLSFQDKGEEFIDPDHSYTEDLDVFGEGSLFQWINAANTYMGRCRLRDFLAQSPERLEEVWKRQEAVKELEGQLGWRQRFTAEGMRASEKVQSSEALLGWARQRDEFFLKSWVLWGARLFPAVTILLILLAAVRPTIPYYIPVAALIIQYLALKPGRKKRAEIFSALHRYKDSLHTYDKMLWRFEKRRFASPYLKELKRGLQSESGKEAHRQIGELARIEDAASNRHNPYYFIFNILMLWDYQCVIALERWKERSGEFIEQWLDTIGELEALTSLSVIGHDYPHWAVPQISDGVKGLKAQEIGHPLLTRERVANDLTVELPVGILLITGSNMSGKSTLLRTAGVNLVLAYAGARVCAQEFRCSMMKVYASMRVSDNLEKRISSFYAELLKIKNIVKAAEDGQPVLFLLDEVFRGTNSRDRHTGARILIKKLMGEGALGLVSTHDLELSMLEKESHGHIKNFHFREFYDGSSLRFDYKLRSGVSTTRNALYLMRMAGIDVKEEDA